MTRALTLLLLGVALASCSFLPKVQVPKETLVERRVPCVKEKPVRPALRSPDDILQMDEYRRTLAAWAELEKLWGYLPLVEAVVEGCSRLPP